MIWKELAAATRSTKSADAPTTMNSKNPTTSKSIYIAVKPLGCNESLSLDASCIAAICFAVHPVRIGKLLPSTESTTEIRFVTTPPPYNWDLVTTLLLGCTSHCFAVVSILPTRSSSTCWIRVQHLYYGIHSGSNCVRSLYTKQHDHLWF
jgi:hypothetical protein